MMPDSRWVTQTTFYNPDDPDACTGNCTEAAVASLFGLPLDEVPKWAGIKSPEFWWAIDAFIGTMGYDMHMMSEKYAPSGLYLASGPSLRGCSHMVVMEGGELKHDPHPSRAGLISVEHVWLMVPKDPAKFVTKPHLCDNGCHYAESVGMPEYSCSNGCMVDKS